MLGECTYSVQETAHLLLSVPLVRTSVSFQTVNLASEGSYRELDILPEDPIEEQAGDGEEDGRTGRRVTGDSWMQRFEFWLHKPRGITHLLCL